MEAALDRHAFRSRGTKWAALEVPAEFPEGALVKAKMGANSLVLVRNGETVMALHDTCAHAGCSLAEGKLLGSMVECDCHGSRYEMATGHLKRGPSVYDQPAYEVRRSEKGWEARRANPPKENPPVFAVVMQGKPRYTMPDLKNPQYIIGVWGVGYKATGARQEGIPVGTRCRGQ